MARTPAADQTAATATALPIEVTKSGRTRRRKGCERTDLTTNTKQTGQTQQVLRAKWPWLRAVRNVPNLTNLIVKNCTNMFNFLLCLGRIERFAALQGGGDDNEQNVEPRDPWPH